VGLYQRSGSRFWWMSYTMNDVRYFESTKTTSKDLATKIWKRREGEIALGLFKVGWAGERMTFEQLSEEFERSHFAGLAKNTVRGHRTYLRHLKAFFGNCTLDKITVEMVETYRDQRRQQPAERKSNQAPKGATVNRELECLKCVLDLAFKRKYIPENPASTVKHFNELRERPVRRMLTLEEERHILEVAPPHLRVAIILLSQTGGGRIARVSHCVGTRWISTTKSSAWTTM
jgi:Phage integrase SAM-like domain